MTTHTASRGALLLATIAMTLAGCSKSAAPTTSPTTSAPRCEYAPAVHRALRTWAAVSRLPWREWRDGGRRERQD